MLLLASQRLLHTEPGKNMPALLLLQWRWQGQQTRHMSEQSEDRLNKQLAAHLVPLVLLPHTRWQQRQQPRHCSRQAPQCQVPEQGKQLLPLCTALLWAARGQPAAARSSC